MVQITTMVISTRKGFRFPPFRMPFFSLALFCMVDFSPPANVKLKKQAISPAISKKHPLPGFVGVDLVYDADKVPLCLGEDVACTAYPHGIEGEGNSIQGNVSPVQILHVGKAAVIAADVVASV